MEKSIRRYQNRAIEATQVFEELIALPKTMQEARRRGEELGLDSNELAFYDSLAQSESAKEIMGDEQLCVTAQGLLQTIKNNVAIVWTIKESARAHIRRLVKHILNKYGYPPDKRDEAVKILLQQAEIMAGSWV